MKNISLHAPLNDTNRNWERALIKKANSGGSSLEKGTYAFTIYSVPEEMIASFPNPPELITTDTPEYSLYHLEKTTPIEGDDYTASGLVVLHNYNDLTLGISIRNTAVSKVKLADVFAGMNNPDAEGVLGDITFGQGGADWEGPIDGDVVPQIYIQDYIFNETLYDAIRAFLDYEFPQQFS